jgi:hypothetical protein
MYVPVYRSGALTNAKERFDALRGFVYLPRVTDLMSGILDGRKLQIDFALFSGAKADPEQQLFVSDPRVASGGGNKAGITSIVRSELDLFLLRPARLFQALPSGQDLLLLLGGIISVLLCFPHAHLARASRTHSNLLAT